LPGTPAPPRDDGELEAVGIRQELPHAHRAGLGSSDERFVWDHSAEVDGPHVLGRVIVFAVVVRLVIRVPVEHSHVRNPTGTIALENRLHLPIARTATFAIVTERHPGTQI
jgi:hypothetical protein